VTVFPGNYEDYLLRKEGASAGAGNESAKRPEPTLDDVPGLDRLDQKKRVNPIKMRQMEERCEELEQEIAGLESVITKTENALTTFVSMEETQRLTTLLDEKRTALSELMEEWEEVSQFLQANA
jgi:ATP-binding cassette subfamily F protein 3